MQSMAAFVGFLTSTLISLQWVLLVLVISFYATPDSCLIISSSFIMHDITIVQKTLTTVLHSKFAVSFSSDGHYGICYS